MPITTDISSALAKVDQLLPKVLRGAETGLDGMKPVLEEAMRTDPAHGDITHAAHDSYFVAPLGGAQDGQQKADQAYAIAAERIADYGKHGLSGHGGQAERIDVPSVGEFERGLLLGSPVNYAKKLDDEGRSPVKPIMQQYSPAITQSVARGIKDELR